MQSNRFVAECLWPDVTPADVAALDRRLGAGHELQIVHLGTTHVPSDDVVFVWFEGGSADDVSRRCLAAGVPFDRIVAVTGWPTAIPAPPHERTRP